MKPTTTDHRPYFRAMSMTDSTSPIRLSSTNSLDNQKSTAMPQKSRTSVSPCLCKVKALEHTIIVKRKDLGYTTGWNDNPTVPKMSMFHSISPLHRQFPRVELNTILLNLKEAFRLLSLDTIFHNSPDLAATCQSLDQVELEVRLFECLHDSSQIVLELNRVAGDTIAYHGYARRILTACFHHHAIGDIGNKENRKQPTYHLRSFEAPTDTQDFFPRETTQTSLENVMNMLMTDRYDARCLGLESLVFLTDPSKTFPSVATRVARSILLGQNNSTDSRIQERLFSLALHGRWPDTPPLDEYRVRLDKPHVHLALLVLANAASHLRDKSEFKLFLESASRMTSGISLIEALQERVRNAHMEPHAACLATRILTAIYRGHPDAVHACLQPATVLAAQEVGHIRHAALEAESLELLAALLRHVEAA